MNGFWFKRSCGLKVVEDGLKGGLEVYGLEV